MSAHLDRHHPEIKPEEAKQLAAADQWTLDGTVNSSDNARQITASVAYFICNDLHLHSYHERGTVRWLSSYILSLALSGSSNLTGFFYLSATAPRALEQKQRLLELPAHRLINRHSNKVQQCVWQRFLEQQPAAVAALLSPGVRKTEKVSSTFNESDISNAEEFIQTLKPIRVAICFMSEETHPTFSTKAPLHAQFLRATLETIRNSPFIIELKEAIRHTYHPWFTTDPLKYGFAASVLHLDSHSHWMRSKA